MSEPEEEGLGVTVAAGFEQAVMRTRIALRSHGFSILSEMASPPTIGSVQGRSHLFMTVWEQLVSSANLGGPGLDVGDHLPCNVVVFEGGGGATVACLDPTEGVEGWPDAAGPAAAAHSALVRMLEAVSAD